MRFQHYKHRLAGVRVILGYKAWTDNPNVSHIGLGVASTNTAKCLRDAGVQAQTAPLLRAEDIRKVLDNAKGDPITHVVISAPWVPTQVLAELSQSYPEVEFAVTCHSNVGFLQVDPFGIRLIKEEIHLEKSKHNFHIAGNSKKYCEAIEAAFGAPCEYLPNLYHLEDAVPCNKPLWPDIGGVLRIGIFGAVRPQKNFLMAVAAASQIARHLNTQAEVWINSGRRDAGKDTDTISVAAQEWCKSNPRVTLKFLPWCPWPEFRHVVGSMHLMIQPSYTESFNMVTADGVAEGVASVVSNAIDWAPKHWKAEIDDQTDIARIGLKLLFDRHAVAKGRKALEYHNETGLDNWIKYLIGTNPLTAKSWWGAVEDFFGDLF